MVINVLFCFLLLFCIFTPLLFAPINIEKKSQNRFCAPWRSSVYVKTLMENGGCSNIEYSNIVLSFTSHFYGEYRNIMDPQIAIHGDTVCDYEKYSGLNLENAKFHIPSEQKSLNGFKRLSYNLENMANSLDISFLRPNKQEEQNDNLLFFPRIKHFRKKLPVLTPEPYQRLMTFAIEVCMIPKLWYLELIHCMYMGMAPFFKGMLMSYSLQDVVGSAIMTIGYLDLSFSIENCHRSVSMVSDDSISPNYEYICDKMKTCLESKVFENGEYAKFKDEFVTRINNIYKSADVGVAQLGNIASYFLRLGISTSPNSNGYSKDYNVRNFLPVRTMASMVSIINIYKRFDSHFANIRQFNKFYHIISFSTFISVKKYFISCKKFLNSNIKINLKEKGLLFEFLCKDFISVGFIDESFNIMGDDEDKFIQATQPSRILRKNYADVIPSMPSDESLESFGKEWLEFAADEFEITEAPLSRPATGRFYKSKLLSKTKKEGMMDSRFVSSKLVSKRTTCRKATARATRAISRVLLPKIFTKGLSIKESEIDE
ncbi:putative Secreted Protein [Cryptosporidium xiaoi]|uniref:Secreted Protein n=1 Tax=Cryptosporidium xiaoi TaxID=659607 RepID=A0AAV9Y142_9CRYT